MPLVTIDLIDQVFTTEQKQDMIRKITDTMTEIEGESMRSVTWVRINEFKENHWAIGGQTLDAAAVHAIRDSAEMVS